MESCLDAALGLILESGVSVGNKDHISSAINDTIVWICSNVIKELFDGIGSVFSG